MSQTVVFTGGELADALRALGVRFLLGGNGQAAFAHRSPARLIAALAESGESRLRLALIPLFLERPSFAARVRSVSKKLAPPARLTLQCYYTAAVWLAQKYQPSARLPDYFSGELGVVPSADPDENLRALARRHGELSGRRVNWLGTYLHAAQIWRKGREDKNGQRGN